jgi:ferritin
MFMRLHWVAQSPQIAPPPVLGGRMFPTALKSGSGRRGERPIKKALTEASCIMLIPKPVMDKLIDQVTHEFHAAHNYLEMACRLDALSLKMLSGWFLKQAEEERQHGHKILKYLLDVGAEVKLRDIPPPSGDFTSPVAIVQCALDQEMTVTRQIYDLVGLAEQHKDYATRSFLEWFVDEQVEEVSTMTDLLHIVKMAGEHQMLQVELRVARLLETRAE